VISDQPGRTSTLLSHTNQQASDLLNSPIEILAMGTGASASRKKMTSATCDREESDSGECSFTDRGASLTNIISETPFFLVLLTTPGISHHLEQQEKRSTTAAVVPPSTNIMSVEVRRMLPLYYDDSKIRSEERGAALNAWKKIAKNEALGYLFLKSTGGLHGASKYHYDAVVDRGSATSMFYDIYFLRLFDVHPVSHFSI
jgi:hypothetical protein